MANTTSNKSSIQKNVIYDSGNDIATGKKRAVDFTGGVSVAERARLFGTQVTHSSAQKNPQSQRTTLNKQLPPTTTKSNVTHQDRNYQPYKTNANRYPKQDTNYTSPERVYHHYESPSPVQISERSKPEPSSPNNSQKSYSTVPRPPFRHHQYQQQPQQRLTPTYDTFQSRIKQEQPSNKANYTQVIPGESYTYDDDPYYQSYASQRSLPLNSNHFQPIQDPLEVLYRNSAPIYSQPQMPSTVNNSTDGMQAFDLGNLINRIQQDYLNNVRPYVSSVQFIEDEQNLASIGVFTPSSSRKNYSRRNNDIYLRQGASYHYDIIDMNGLYPRFAKSPYNDKHYSSVKERRHRRRRYHDRALSPIHIFEPSGKPPLPPKSPPAAPVEKPATPVAASSSEEDDTTAANTKTEETKTSSESEEESTEDVVAAPSKPSTETPLNEITRPTLPTPPAASRIPPKLVSSESSESDESDSDSDSDSDEEEEEEPKPAPVARFNNTRTTPATPQTNTRVIPLRTATNTNDITSQPPETSHSVQSFDLEDSKKSSRITSRFRSIFNKIRRRKS